MALLIADNVVPGYDRKAVAPAVSFSVEEGNFLCIVGANGTGKTTLIRTLTGLQKPLSGRVIFDKGFSKTQAGFVPQFTHSAKDFPASVREVVLSGCLSECRFRPFYSRVHKKRASENMQKLEIEDLSSSSFQELSGGQQQRVLLARALCSAQKMIFLDEPTANLDPNASENVYQLLERMCQDEKAVIMITHDIKGALKYATHVLSLSGENAFFGTQEEYAKSTLSKEGGENVY